MYCVLAGVTRARQGSHLPPRFSASEFFLVVALVVARRSEWDDCILLLPSAWA